MSKNLAIYQVVLQIYYEWCKWLEFPQELPHIVLERLYQGGEYLRCPGVLAAKVSKVSRFASRSKGETCNQYDSMVRIIRTYMNIQVYNISIYKYTCTCIYNIYIYIYIYNINVHTRFNHI